MVPSVLDPRHSAIPGLALAILAWGLSSYSGHDQTIALTAAIAVVCIMWWVFEPIPIPVTSLVPIALFPMLGVLEPMDVAEAYGSPLILLLMGGFLLSRGMESSGAHRRLALGVVRLVGNHSARRLVFGFMLAGALLSMWISNTATVLMLMPVAIAVLDSTDRRDELQAPLLLGLAWACSIGGLGTPIGTTPNLIFMQVYQEYTGDAVAFSQWMGLALPVVALMVPLAAIYLTRRLPRRIAVDLPDTGRWRSAEIRVLGIFAVTALAWITRSEPFGGWKTWLGMPTANDASVAFIAVIALFITRDREGEPLITWQQAVQIPWGVLLLFAGGICLAKAFATSGLSSIAGDALVGFAQLPVYVTLFLIALAVTFMTEATSNTATTALLMPILAAAAVSAGLNPMLMMVPAALSASCAFMLPVATGPNAVVFGTDRIPIRTMAREGFAMNLAGTIIITVLMLLLLPS